MPSTAQQAKDLIDTINKIREDSSRWNSFVNECRRILTNSNEQIRYDFQSGIVAEDVVVNMTNIPPMSRQEIERICKNDGAIRGAIKLIDCVFRFDDAFYQFITTLIKYQKQSQLVRDLINVVASHLPEFSEYHREVVRPSLVSNTGPTGDLSTARTVDRAMYRNVYGEHSNDVMSEPHTVDTRMGGHPPDGDVMLSASLTVDRAQRAYSSESNQSHLQRSAALPIDARFNQQQSSQYTSNNTVGTIQSEAQPVDNALQQRYNELLRKVEMVHGSLENFQIEYQNRSVVADRNTMEVDASNNERQQLDVFRSEDFHSDD